ncbi:T9SS type A sorting domain-containing protein [Aequorivita sp. SDUM287046]|uniref:T9SS type A sorting domain-containing protein n=1 Tax=Aequorivita aurantiaca TaxID=3053356 RepID=A0ABT8DHZ3_9FLAO|nr:T9SS type A sorting domain-containing protein [Aequorivita aurantiaca]MDN3722798.1 T9SS type A sorting domain-containing protein [Aequorivita aurantiaca]
MKKITLFAALLCGAVSFAQVAGTSFEEPEALSGKYTDVGDPNVAHDLVNNAGEPIVDFTSTGGELGFNATYTPYDTPDVGLTDGDFVGVTDFTPSPTVMFTDGSKGYQMNDIDGNMILTFDQVDLTGVSSPAVSIDFLLSINDTPANGNYEGDGTVNESGSDRLRIYVRDLTNSTEIDLFNSTGTDLDDLVPFDAGSGEYQLQWQNAMVNLSAGSTVQLVIEGRTNASAESFWFDNIEFLGAIGVNEFSADQFAVYPNPAIKGYVNISSKVSGAKNISIFDVLGKQVVKTTLNGDKLDISALNSGVYILKIEQGKTSATKKLVVK